MTIVAFATMKGSKDESKSRNRKDKVKTKSESSPKYTGIFSSICVVKYYLQQQKIYFRAIFQLFQVVYCIIFLGLAHEFDEMRCIFNVLKLKHSIFNVITSVKCVLIIPHEILSMHMFDNSNNNNINIDFNININNIKWYWFYT